MASVLDNKNRCGSFSNSEIYKLVATGKGENGFGAPAITYIEEVNIERRMGIHIDTETYSQPMSWGLFLQNHVWNMLDFGYELAPETTTSHPTISDWCGSTDLLFPMVKIGEIKCYQRKKFVQYTDVLLQKNIALLKKEFPQEYFQIVGNSIVNMVDKGEAISYMPYHSELGLIREAADAYDGEDAWKYAFIANSEDNRLPYLPDNGYYKNLNTFEFKIPNEDIDLLCDKVLLAKTMLKSRPVNEPA